MDHLLIRKFRHRLLAWLHRSRSGRVFFVRRIPYKDVKRATDGFQRVIYSNSEVTAYAARFGEGGGGVFLVKEVKDFGQQNDVFCRQIQFLGRLHHRHLLSLKGFSVGKHKRLLIFDNIENGSLKEHLNDPLKTPLNWRTRLQIANEVVAALEYLFLFSDPPAYHVSISSSNIMLDENFAAKLSDFSLLTPSTNSVMMPNSGDSMKQKSCKIIFQLGVLILELVTGQSSEMEGSDLIPWIQQSRFYNSIDKMIDPDLGNNYDCTELKNLLAVAKLCIKSRDKATFTISQLFRYLQRKIDISHDKVR
ncbi:probable receptor-like protein kinase At1g49730 [Arachis duranensis]|uniref:Probable receptor-like protein kinase At1g49730 n=1 Tax=Arachis duranensis TaxID=130453 RepID=A0A6P4B4J2_ARADU|nr:probable receptor-like protein kinase At1g49730 [Arachis duranensis]XP_052112319.1 probable receptor-like protein kinase At1g49730 [Arachis duranensis]